MTPTEINALFSTWQPILNRTIVIIDYANVDFWKDNLGWKPGVRELANLVKHFSSSKELRRFYFGSDFGKNTTSTTLIPYSKTILDAARYNNLKVITKRVKYINGSNEKKCNMDIEMALDLIKMRRQYDNIVLFTGDGDMAAVLEYVVKTYQTTQKKAYVFSVRGGIGAELIDAKTTGVITDIFYAEDFEYRLSMNRQRNR
jgi:uncharacterized LabA/DUF88 family protein